jgi:hypothetical protein
MKTFSGARKGLTVHLGVAFPGDGTRSAWFPYVCQ